jgi:DNA-binding transcriptional regulator YiaG
MEQQIDVRAIRQTLKLTQAQLAERMGVDQSTVSNWENGSDPRGPAKKLLCQLAAEKDFLPREREAAE